MLTLERYCWCVLANAVYASISISFAARILVILAMAKQRCLPIAYYRLHLVRRLLHRPPTLALPRKRPGQLTHLVCVKYFQVNVSSYSTLTIPMIRRCS